MSETSNQAYTFGTASLEVVLMLVGAFLVGALVCYLLKKMGLCCKKTASSESVLADNANDAALDADPVAQMRARISANTPTTAYPPTVNTQMPTMEQETTYEADLRTLLKGRSSEHTSTSTSKTASASATTATEQATSRATAFPSRVTPAAPPTPTQTVVETTVATLVLPDDDHVDDLKKLEGIGPRIEKLLNDAGIKSYAKLATMDRDTLKAILDAGGGQFKLHEPKSWPYQAELAAKQNWQRLKEYQDFLVSGRNN